MRSRQRSAAARSLVSGATVLALVLGTILVGGGQASAAGGDITHRTVSTDFGTASYTAWRRGWSVYVAVKTRDIKADGFCVTGDVQIKVAGWSNPRRTHFGKACGRGHSASDTVKLTAGWGFSFSSLEVRICRDKVVELSCKPAVMTVKPNKADWPSLSSQMTKYMNESMSAFQRNKKNHPGRFDWSDDGCSIPEFASVIVGSQYKSYFRDSCERHDFGYRNYGHGLTIAPFDSRREFVDLNFRKDMRNWCAGHRTGSSLSACYSAAQKYVDGVRLGGGFAFYRF